MGASGSVLSLKGLSASDIGDLVAGLGNTYLVYKPIIINNGISGKVLSRMNEEEIKGMLSGLGITNTVHKGVISAHFGLINNQQQQQQTVSDKLGQTASSSTNPPNPANKILNMNIVVNDRCTLSPRTIMTRIFEIQGIPVDPTELGSAIDRIKKVCKKGFGDGVERYDCFISYRVTTDQILAERIFYALKNVGRHPFFDKACLRDGEKWKNGFLKGSIYTHMRAMVNVNNMHFV